MLREQFRRLVVQDLLGTGAYLVLGSVAGYLTGGMPGLWGALIGGAMVSFFTGATIVIMWLVADRPIHIVSAALVGAWFLKTLVLIGVIVALRGATFYHEPTLGVVAILGIVGALVLDCRFYLTARVPLVSGPPNSASVG